MSGWSPLRMRPVSASAGWLKAEALNPCSRRSPAAGVEFRVGYGDEQVDWGDYVLLPKRPEAAAAGAETPPAPSGSEYFALRQDWVRSVCGVEPEALRLELAVGELMTPTIKNGRTLLIDTTDTAIRSFGIYVLEINGERLVKPVQRKHDGGLVLISDNTAYQPDVSSPTKAAEVTVLGRVVWAGGVI